jgi:FemAB-related protein (PEP-CTERM system-associated)
VIQRVFGKQDVSLVARDPDGRILGVLPLVRLKSRLFGDFLVSMPYFNYGGPLAVDGATETRLLEAAVKRCEALGVEHMEIRETQTREAWPQRTEKVNMILPLPRDYAELDAGLGTKVRAQTKRAERENVRVQIGGVELLDAFYRVFAINMRDLGTPVYSRAFFRALLECDAFYTRLIVVELDGRPVATAFLASHGDMLEIPWASTLKQANAVSMNMFLYRHVLSHAIDHGYEFFDFGRSSRDSSTYRFKQQWGAQPVQNYWHYWLAGGGELPQLNPNNPKFRLLIATWRRLPVLLTRVIGPHVVKHLP